MWRELAADDIAEIIGRSRDTVRDYVTRFVQNGRLVQKYPEQPNHPQQAYKRS